MALLDVSKTKFLPNPLQLVFLVNAVRPKGLKAKEVITVKRPAATWNAKTPLKRADLIVLGETKIPNEELAEMIQQYSHEAGCVLLTDPDPKLIKELKALGFTKRGPQLLQKATGSTPEEYGQGYIDRWGDNDWLANAKLEAEQILSHLPKRMKKDRINLLDVGCLNGYIMEAVRRGGVKNVYGTDISYFLAVEKNVNPTFLPGVTVGDFSENDYPDNAFDVVVCMEVLEHIPPELTQTFVKEMARITKPDGILLLSTSEDWFADDTHINCRNRAEWYAIFAKHGLVQEGSQVIFPGFNSFVVRPTLDLGEKLKNRLTTSMKLVTAGRLKRPEGR